MSKHYPLDELIKRWEREELTVEQAIGQLLLRLIDLSKRVDQLEIMHRSGHKSELE